MSRGRIELMGQESCGKGCTTRNCPCTCHIGIRRLLVREYREADHADLVAVGLLAKELGAKRVRR